MSKESAEKFVLAWENSDPAIVEAVSALPKDDADWFEVVAGVAVKLGYEVTSDELKEAFAAQVRKKREELEGREMSNEELEQVAGGAKCSSDYNPNDWCWFNDRCTSANIFYPQRSECQSTYDPSENCPFSDNCNDNFNTNYPTNPKRNDRTRVF